MEIKLFEKWIKKTKQTMCNVKDNNDKISHVKRKRLMASARIQGTVKRLRGRRMQKGNISSEEYRR